MLESTGLTSSSVHCSVMSVRGLCLSDNGIVNTGLFELAIKAIERESPIIAFETLHNKLLQHINYIAYINEVTTSQQLRLPIINGLSNLGNTINIMLIRPSILCTHALPLLFLQTNVEKKTSQRPINTTQVASNAFVLQVD